ncbi:MAG: hypothetical protein FJY98_03645 [Candidatus Liptonbacteria bacterium]|nr:hypothetical protein [Candidatus Liptonbacteria bacterium]
MNKFQKDVVLGVIGVAVLLVGIVYFFPKPQPTTSPSAADLPLPPAQSAVSTSSSLTIEGLSANITRQMFPNASAKELAELTTLGVKMELKKTFQGNFLDNEEKETLYVIEAEGIPHAGGFYHVFLKVFDAQGNLRTPSTPDIRNAISFPRQLAGEFGEDGGDIAIYSCKSTDYVFSGIYGLINGFGHANGKALLLKIEQGTFNTVQTFESTTPNQNLIFKPLENKIAIYEKQTMGKNYVCPNSCLDDMQPYVLVKIGEKKWNTASCRFE